MGLVVKFLIWSIRLAFIFAGMGILKSAALTMVAKAAHAEQHMISYSKFTHMLTAPLAKNKSHDQRAFLNGCVANL